MQTGGSGGFKAEINVTPLVDVVLVLLIIFMVVTPLLQRGHAVELPKAENVVNEKAKREQVQVTLTVSRERYIGSALVTEEEMRLQLESHIIANPNIEFVVKGDKSLEYGDIRALMAECRQVGAKRVILATRERKAGG